MLSIDRCISPYTYHTTDLHTSLISSVLAPHSSLCEAGESLLFILLLTEKPKVFYQKNNKETLKN